MTANLTQLGAELGRWLTGKSTNGLAEPVNYDLAAAFPNNSIMELQDALAELQEDELIHLTVLMGPTFPRVQILAELFFEFDPVVNGTNPREDAKTLAQLILADEQLANVALLDKAAGWDRRRFNPAMLYLLKSFDKGRFSAVLQDDYPTKSLLVGPTERVRMRRLVGW